jgi:hypothetical protein
LSGGPSVVTPNLRTKSRDARFCEELRSPAAIGFNQSTGGIKIPLSVSFPIDPTMLDAILVSISLSNGNAPHILATLQNRQAK